MLECLKHLVDIGNNSVSEMNNSCLSIEKVGEICEGQSYYYQEYKVNSTIEMTSYSLHNLNKFPKGSYVANTQNIYQGEFLVNENFRILIPKEKLTENINGQIEVIGVCQNYPIFYGEAPSGKQDYVLTYSSFGNVDKVFNINLNVNTGKVIVSKKDSDTNINLQGVKFELISEDGNYRVEGITDQNGEIHFENLLPGKYILKEVQTLNEYEINEDKFEIEVKYNSVKRIEIFNNLKKGNIKIIKVDEEDEEIKIDGVYFELYNENMELLEVLITNEKGETESEFYPSENKKYFLKEIETKDGYILNRELIEIVLENNVTLEYIVKNKKVYIQEKPKLEEIIPEETEPQKEVELPKLPKTGM